MDDTKVRKSATEVYSSVASKDGLLYHIAHARKENSDEEYNGEQLLTTAKGRRSKDIARFREAAMTFKDRSIPRK